jgi:hypothetical protein
MIDVQKIDALFDAEARVGWVLFDKRVLFPLEEIAQHHADEADPLSEEDLRMAAARGWFSIQSGAGPDGDKDGCPVYVPDRLLFFARCNVKAITRKSYG